MGAQGAVPEARDVELTAEEDLEEPEFFASKKPIGVLFARRAGWGLREGSTGPRERHGGLQPRYVARKR